MLSAIKVGVQTPSPALEYPGAADITEPGAWGRPVGQRRHVLSPNPRNKKKEKEKEKKKKEKEKTGRERETERERESERD